MQKNRGVRSAVKTWVVDKMQLLSEERWKNVEALASLLKSPVVILLGLIGFPGWNGAFGLFMPVTWVAVIVYILAAAAWIFLWIRFGQSLKRDCILVISVVVFACGHFHWMMRSASATYLMAAPLQLGKDMVFAKNYEFFGREVRLIPLDKNWKWSLVSRIYAPSLQTQFLKTTASESGNSIDNSVEVALADGTDPTMDSKWRRLNLPRWTITRSAEVDETIDPIRFVPSPNAKDDNLSLITPARAGLPGLFSTPVGDFELSESWRRAIFQMELFNALKETPTDLILKTLELEAARQANDNILLQSTAIRLLLVRRLANGRFFTPHLKSEMVRAIRMAEHRKWSESNPWFPTLISAMREVNADIISDGKASGNLIEIAARPNADENNWSADNWLKKASPAWLDRSTPRDRTDEEEEQFRTNFAGAMRLGPEALLEFIEGELESREQLEIGDRRAARSFLALPMSRFVPEAREWVERKPEKKHYRAQVLIEVSSYRLAVNLLYMQHYLTNGGSYPSALRSKWIEDREKLSQAYVLLPPELRVLYSKQSQGQLFFRTMEDMFNIIDCKVQWPGDHQCEARTRQWMLQQFERFSGGGKPAWFLAAKLELQDIEFAIEDALEWTDRDIRADAPPNSLQIIDRIFAIYIVRTIWDERSDIPVLAYRSVCDGALNLSQSLLRDDDGMQEVATHQALLELEPICPKLDYAQHKRVVNLMTTL